MRTVVRIEGIPELVRKLKAIKGAIGADLAFAGEKGMMVVEGSAKEKVPVDTGDLRRRITTKVLKQTKNTAEVAVGTNLKYAPYVEFGTGLYAESGEGRKTPWRYRYAGKKGRRGWRWTRGMRGKPYLRPAWDENKGKVAEVVREELGRIIQEASE